MYTFLVSLLLKNKFLNIFQLINTVQHGILLLIICSKIEFPYIPDLKQGAFLAGDKVLVYSADGAHVCDELLYMQANCVVGFSELDLLVFCCLTNDCYLLPLDGIDSVR